ncbi:MAG TPA: tRNA epoxyqueuosine(34) reductase QueG [Polyangiaceae bacterium]|nr:tRNA epoxyqueuosine(34) reductase QueG [Polyangiaceae bacterium]
MSATSNSKSGPPTQPTLAARIAEAALELGFARVGFARVERFDDAGARLRAWLASGYHGALSYLEGEDRADPRALLPEAKTIVAVALSYAEPRDAGADRGVVALRAEREGPALCGSVARYARGEDYHLIMKRKLQALSERCAALLERPVVARVCVDTAPLLEHEVARRAGIGFSAKSTLTIAPGLGSYVLLGELLLDIELPPSEPLRAGCGSCRACLDACPTGAFVDAHVLDARRCISYLTIENDGPIPRELRAPIGTRVFGCDVCQEVCPFNATGAPRSRVTELTPRRQLDVVDLVALLELGAAGYRKLVRRTALRRVNRDTLARNAAVALGNTADRRAVAPLSRALEAHPSALVRAHAAWALGELGFAEGPSLQALAHARDADGDGNVREEAASALARLVPDNARPAARVPA